MVKEDDSMGGGEREDGQWKFGNQGNCEALWDNNLQLDFAKALWDTHRNPQEVNPSSQIMK